MSITYWSLYNYQP